MTGHDRETFLWHFYPWVFLVLGDNCIKVSKMAVFSNKISFKMVQFSKWQVGAGKNTQNEKYLVGT